MRDRLLSALVVVAATALTIATLTVAAQADDGPAGPLELTGDLQPTPEPTALPTSTPSQTPQPTPGMPATPSATAGVPLFRAADGHDYPAGPTIVKSLSKNELYWGEDFDAACYDDAYFAKGLANLERLAKVVEASGRRAAFTVAPNKSSVDKTGLKGVKLPHRGCARRGLHQQRRLLRSYHGAHFVPVLPALEARDERTYWRTDTHWNPLGAAVYAKLLGSSLDKRVGRTYDYRQVVERRHGDLAKLLQRKAREVGTGTVPTMKVKVRPAPGTPHVDLKKVTTPDYRWTTTPPRRAISGRTLLAGDSFTFIGLQQLQPLFADGHFLWTGNIPTSQMIQGIVDSDTVVFEVVQRYVARSVLSSDAFLADVTAALSDNPDQP